MSPRILFVGGAKGAWQVRGLQMAKALGGRATVKPTENDWQWADLIVLVKRGIYEFGEAAAKTGKPVVWDVLDVWQQPEENGVSIAEMTARVRETAAKYRVSLMIGATQSMADAIGGVYLPHHYRPGTVAKPVRKEIQTVAYEGASKYLGSWASALMSACEKRKWEFVVNPKSLADADIIVALRGEHWDGALCREWKSGVKLVNAMACGRPVICQESAAQREVPWSGETVDSTDHVLEALDFWASYESRLQAASLTQSAVQFTLDAVARQYRGLCQSLLKVAA